MHRNFAGEWQETKGTEMSPVVLLIIIVFLLLILPRVRADREGSSRVFSGRDWEVLEPNSTYDVEAVFIPDLEYRVLCSCGCQYSVYNHRGVIDIQEGEEIPTGQFLRFRVWNSCFERNLVVIRGVKQETPGAAWMVLISVTEFFRDWPLLVGTVVLISCLCIHLRMTPADIVRDFLYLEPIPR